MYGGLHASEAVSKWALEHIHQLESDLGVKIVSCAIDSAANMVRARQLMMESRPTILSVPCQAHILNLLAKDLLAGDTLDKVTQVAKFVRAQAIILKF